LLVWTVNYATRRSVSTWRRLEQVQQMENHFREKRPAAGTVNDYASRLRGNMLQMAQTLESLHAFLNSRQQPAEVMVRLPAALPASTQIVNMDINAETRTVGFGVVVPDDPGGRSIQAPALIALWAKDRVLMGQISGMRSVLSQRDKIDGRNCVLLKFECTLAGGE